MTLINQIDADDFDVIAAFCDKFGTTAHVKIDPYNKELGYTVYIMRDQVTTVSHKARFLDTAARLLAEELYRHLNEGVHTIYPTK